MPFKTCTFTDADKGINLQLPGNKAYWATGRNVRFTQGFVSKSLGKSLKATTPGAQPIRAMFSYVNAYGKAVTIVCSDAAVYAYNEDFSGEVALSAYLNITPYPAPTGDADSVWTFALVSGLLFVSNGKERVWEWWDIGRYFYELDDALTGIAAKFIGSCMHRLVLSNVTVRATTYPGRIMWSEAGNPENFTLDLQHGAGIFDLLDYRTGAGIVVTIKGQIFAGQNGFFFGEKGLWVCDFAQQLKQFMLADRDVELLAPRAVCQAGGAIFFIGKTDIYRTVTGKAEPIGLPVRKNLFASINVTYEHRSFAFAPYGANEVWFCIPTGTSTQPDTAYIYNYELNNWTVQDVDFLCHSVSYDDL